MLKRYLLHRPDLRTRKVSPATLNSLPSGHATAVFSAVAALLLVVPTRWRYPTALAGLVMATVTAFATMSAGWHRAGDSMAAFLLVGVWTAVASAAVVIAQTPAASDPAPFEWPASARWLAAVSAAVFILGLTLGAALDTAGSIRDSTLGSWNAFIVGGLLITGTGIGVILSILHLLELMDTSSQQTTSPPATSRRDAQ